MYRIFKIHLFTLCTFFFICALSVPLHAKCIEGNCKNGLGTLLFPGGSKYIGKWKNGQMNGKGEFIFSSGARYLGEWSEDKLVHYSDLGNTLENNDIEKRFLDKNFDPSTDFPPAAAGSSTK